MTKSSKFEEYKKRMRELMNPPAPPNIVPSLLDRLGKRGTQLPRLPKQPRMPKV